MGDVPRDPGEGWKADLIRYPDEAVGQLGQIGQPAGPMKGGHVRQANRQFFHRATHDVFGSCLAQLAIQGFQADAIKPNRFVMN